MPQMSPMGWLALELSILAFAGLVHSSLYFGASLEGISPSPVSSKSNWEW